MNAKHSLLLTSLLLTCQTSVAAERFKPEQIVISVKGKPLVACMAESSLVKLVEHLNAGERTKAAAMFNEDCFSIEPDQPFKVLAVKPYLMEIGLIGTKLADGIWVLPQAFAPARLRP